MGSFEDFSGVVKTFFRCSRTCSRHSVVALSPLGRDRRPISKSSLSESVARSCLRVTLFGFSL
ncbi:hypothetical protein ABIE52_002977 [Rhodococcus sp. OAS809]